MINLIFGLRGRASVLAHALPHSVIGLTLPPIDANTFFIKFVGLSDWLEKRVASSMQVFEVSEVGKPYQYPSSIHRLDFRGKSRVGATIMFSMLEYLLALCLDQSLSVPCNQIIEGCYQRLLVVSSTSNPEVNKQSIPPHRYIFPF